MIFGTIFLTVLQRKLFRSEIVYDGFNVKDETGRTYWARLTDKKHRLY